MTSATSRPPTVPLATALRDRHRDGILLQPWPEAPDWWRAAMLDAWRRGADAALEGDEAGEAVFCGRVEQLLAVRFQAGEGGAT